VSRLTAAVALAAPWAGAGCATTVGVDKWTTSELAERYARDGRVSLRYGAQVYDLGPSQQAELRVVSLPCGADEQDSDGPARCDEELSAPLDEVRGSRDALRFPAARPLRLQDIESAELVIHGEPLARIEDGVVRPPAKRRHFLGVQLGGSAYFQLVYRYRLVGALLLDVGGFFFGPPVAMNGSAGLILDVPLARRWSAYAGAGGGAGMVIGEGTDPDCPESQPDCPVVAGHTATAQLYGRLGVAVRFGVELRDQVGVDGGVWYGTLENDDGGDAAPERRTFIWPMAGLSYTRAL
jgi:hypothetical protein